MSENQNIPAIEMRGVNVAAMRDASFTVVEDVNWSVAPGEFWVIAGQEHSGKSDLLMLAAGLMMPADGSYKLFGNDTKDFGEAELAERLRVGFVFQGGQLFNQLTIAENVALPLRYQKNFIGGGSGAGSAGAAGIDGTHAAGRRDAVEHRGQLAAARGAGAGADPASRKCCCSTIRWPASARGICNGGCVFSTSCRAATNGSAASR